MVDAMPFWDRAPSVEDRAVLSHWAGGINIETNNNYIVILLLLEVLFGCVRSVNRDNDLCSVAIALRGFQGVGSHNALKYVLYRPVEFEQDRVQRQLEKLIAIPFIKKGA